MPGVAEQIAKLCEAFELKAGDIIYSGTPENVGPVVKGDVLLCKLQGLPDILSGSREGELERRPRETGCVKTPMLNLRVEFLSQFRRCGNRLHRRLLLREDY